MPESTDADLVSQSLRGECDAYKLLVTRYQGHVYGLAYSIVGNWADAQDLAQEAFIRAYSNLDQLREPARFAAWLRRVTFSVTMNRLKAFRPGMFAQLDGRIDLDRLDVPDFRPGPAELAEKRDLADAVMRAVASLPPKYRVPLTMFHLDGLSYQRVADFLDIPLGTAKALIHRATAKLGSALAAAKAEELTPMVQEVFNEHKLPAEFASTVLRNIPLINYRTAECTFCGSVVAWMQYMNDPAPYDFVMGVSGSAFKLVWCRPWCPSNNTLLILGLEVARRTFRSLGYECEMLLQGKPDDWAQIFREKIVQSIRAGRPVIVEGIIGAPEPGIVAGFEDNGRVLLGRSYFHNLPEYYRKEGWEKDCLCVFIPGRKVEPPPRSQVLHEAIEWAVKLARTPQMEHPGPQRVLGLAAYEEWAGAMTRDENFPADDIEKLRSRMQVYGWVTYSGLADARRAAAAFLRRMADAMTSPEQLLLAARLYEQECDLLRQAWKWLPLSADDEAKRRDLADPKTRGRIADVIRCAKELDRQAIEHLEHSLEVTT